MAASPSGPAAVAVTPSPTPPPVTQIEFDHVDGKTIYFRAPEGTTVPKPIDTGLFDLSYLGVIRGKDGALPYFLFSGRSCTHCKEEEAIYIIRADGGRTSRFVYPGKIFDPKTHTLLFDAQSFYGHCLPRHGDVYVVFQRERIDRRRRLALSVFVAEPGSNHLNENLIERRPPRINRTLKLVRHKSCHAIAGRNRDMMRQRLNLRPRDAADKADDEDEDTPPRENQTDRDFKTQ